MYHLYKHESEKMSVCRYTFGILSVVVARLQPTTAGTGWKHFLKKLSEKMNGICVW